MTAPIPSAGAPPGWGDPHGAAPEPPPVELAAERPISYVDAVRFGLHSPDLLMNVVLAVVFSLIPVVGPIVLIGWYTEIFQRLVKGHPRPVPKLDFGDFSAYLQRGFPAFACAMIFAMPVSMGLSLVAGVGMAVAQVSSRSSHDPTPVLVVLGVVGALSAIVSPVVALFSSAVTVRAELTEDVGQAFKASRIFDYVARTWGTTLVAFFVMSMLAVGMSLVGLLACGVGVYVASVVVRLTSVHLGFQIYRLYLARGGEAVPVKQHDGLPSEAGRSSP